MLWSIGDVCHGLGEKDGEDGHTWVAGGGGWREDDGVSTPSLLEPCEWERVSISVL